MPVQETLGQFENCIPAAPPHILRFIHKDLWGEPCGLPRLGFVVIIPTIPVRFTTHSSETFPPWNETFGADKTEVKVPRALPIPGYPPLQVSDSAPRNEVLALWIFLGEWQGSDWKVKNEKTSF